MVISIMFIVASLVMMAVGIFFAIGMLIAGLVCLGASFIGQRFNTCVSCKRRFMTNDYDTGKHIICPHCGEPYVLQDNKIIRQNRLKDQKVHE